MNKKEKTEKISKNHANSKKEKIRQTHDNSC
jgi:hypothetical protein